MRMVTCIFDSPDNARLSLCSKASIVSSTLLLVLHLASLILLVKGNKTPCSHYLPGLSAEIMQVISWIIAIIVLCRILTKNYLIFPGILRFWWVCSFLISACHIAIDFNFIMDNHGQLRIQEYADFLRFFASVSLLVISIQGKMKIAHDNARSNLTEPLLNGETGKKFEGKGESLYSKATLLDLVTFSWLNPLFVIGKKKPLEQDEIPDVDVKDSAAFLSHCFDENFHMQASSDQSVLDLEMAQRLFSAAFSMIQLLGTIAVMSQVAWEVFLIFIPVTAINCKGVSTII